MKMVLLPTIGMAFSEEIEVSSLKDAAAAIGADFVEVVRPSTFYDLGLEQYILLVDESGALKADRTMNLCATDLYGFRLHGNKIYGDVLVAKETVTEDGEVDIAGLSDDDVEIVMAVLASV